MLEPMERCPWCEEPISDRHTPIVIRIRDIYFAGGLLGAEEEYAVECRICGVRGPSAKTKYGAKALWNGLAKKTRRL